MRRRGAPWDARVPMRLGLGWRMAKDLPRAALALRVAHAGITVAMLLAIAEVWRSGLTGRRGRFLRAAEVALVLEIVLVAANRGDCPLGHPAGAPRRPRPALRARADAPSGETGRAHPGRRGGRRVRRARLAFSRQPRLKGTPRSRNRASHRLRQCGGGVHPHVKTPVRPGEWRRRRITSALGCRSS